MSDVLARVNAVFQDVFDDDSIVVTRDTTSRDIDGWDSLMQVTLVVNIERAFGMRFTAAEVSRLGRVGDLVALIEARQGTG